MEKNEFNKFIERVRTVSYPSGFDNIFFVIQDWIDKNPEWFYYDKEGQLWFETPLTNRVKAKILPDKFESNFNFEKEFKNAIFKFYKEFKNDT